MCKWLVATLAAPLASFGEQSGNVRRGTSDRPTRSAILGLAGAALGLSRADTKGQQALAASFGVATHTVNSGTLLVDFHTYQSLPSTKGRVRTRADALSRERDLNTSITHREYRADVFYQVAFKALPNGRYELEGLRSALMQPVYSLYAGRRSCPLSRPLAPRIIEAETVLEAFSLHPDTTLHRSGSGLFAAEDLRDFGRLQAPVRSRLRLDEPGDRLAWHFTPRLEYEYSPPRKSAGDQEVNTG